MDYKEYLKEGRLVKISDLRRRKKLGDIAKADQLNAKIEKLVSNVIDISNHYKNGLVTTDEYKEFLKDVVKVL